MEVDRKSQNRLARGGGGRGVRERERQRYGEEQQEIFHLNDMMESNAQSTDKKTHNTTLFCCSIPIAEIYFSNRPI